MKATLAIFGLALFAILAECKPAEEPAQNLLKKQLGNNLEAAVEEQWVSEVIGYSSQYGRYKWSAKQILGAPDVYPRYQDDKRAWAPDVIDENQFLEFEFDYPVYVTKVDVYETFNAGGVKAIKCFDVSGMWITLWSTPQVSVLKSARIFSPSFTSTTPCFSSRIKLDIDCSVAQTWVEIDAVRLYGTDDSSETFYRRYGTDVAVQWVAGVISYSSQYGTDDKSAQQVLGVPDVYPRYEKSISAWAPDVIDANQFLEVQFATAVYVTKIDVFETFKAGGVKAIKCFDVSVYSALFLEYHSAGYRLHRCKEPGGDRRCEAARLPDLAKREHVNEELEEEEDKVVTSVEAAAAKMSIKQLLAHGRK